MVGEDHMVSVEVYEASSPAASPAATARWQWRPCSPKVRGALGNRREAARFWGGEKWDCRMRGRAFVAGRLSNGIVFSGLGSK
jgi:hypothetical protein